ncbi:hypothetical protein FOZ62_001495 [Perkinsus olseni]|uniref:Uncharacterized protein n=1 Tax=Perkinsus olseni TaxID=32597 RepID=A0A7J6U7G4_PEROL|nr:hypothetical protein FOZ62_001495 [Perkinsus olseni]
MAPPSPVIQHAKLSLTSPLSKTAATDQPVARMCGKKCDRTTWLAVDKPTVTAKPTTVGDDTIYDRVGMRFPSGPQAQHRAAGFIALFQWSSS